MDSEGTLGPSVQVPPCPRQPDSRPSCPSRLARGCQSSGRGAVPPPPPPPPPPTHCRRPTRRDRRTKSSGTRTQARKMTS
eukprot:1185429-Prorocentrum_minimum.AAC.2